MIQRILLTYILIFFGNSYSQDKKTKPFGIGLLEVNTTYPILLYKNEFDKVPFDTIKFELDNDGSINFITKINLNPYDMYGGDSFERGKENINSGLIRFSSKLKFIVIDATKTSFKVVTNENNGTTYFIRINNFNSNDNWYVYESWEKYLKRVQYIIKPNIKIYDKPNGKIICKNANCEFLDFKVIELKGDWIKVKKRFESEYESKKTQNCIGWTKWKNKNKILIDIIEQIYL